MKKLIILALCASVAALCQNTPASGSKTVYAGNTASASVPASTTNYFCTGQSSTNGVEGNRSWVNPAPGVIRSFYLVTTGAQPSSGTMVCTVRINGADSTVSIVVPASQTPAKLSDTTHTAATSAGDVLSIGCTNNASIASATIGGWGFVVK